MNERTVTRIRNGVAVQIPAFSSDDYLPTEKEILHQVRAEVLLHRTLVDDRQIAVISLSEYNKRVDAARKKAKRCRIRTEKE